VIEFNVRFGDPETQVVLARLRTPLGQLLHAAAAGKLADVDPLRWHDGAAVTVVVAAEGYPDDPRSGDVVEGLEEVAEPAYVLHAGTRLDDDGRVVTSGGRVLSVTARAPTSPQPAPRRTTVWPGSACAAPDSVRTSRRWPSTARSASPGDPVPAVSI
jgi:phosphoribosylamine--glycine ligase